MKKFTVISIDEESGQVYSDYVLAYSSENAFASAAVFRNQYSTMIAALPGWLKDGEDIYFPGESHGVCSDTIIEQEEVFGAPMLRITAGDLMKSVLVKNSEKLDTDAIDQLAEELMEDLEIDDIVRDVIEREPSTSDEAREIAFQLIEAALIKNGTIST